MNLDKLTMEQLHGNQREIAETIGIEAYRKLVERYGSSSIYIGKADEAVPLTSPFRPGSPKGIWTSIWDKP